MALFSWIECNKSNGAASYIQAMGCDILYFICSTCALGDPYTCYFQYAYMVFYSCMDDGIIRIFFITEMDAKI